MQDIKSNNFRIFDPQFSEEAGFTLLEVIVAVAILSVSLVMIMQLFAAGLKSSRTSCDYTRAVMHANDKMEELSAAPVKSQESGEFRDGYKWEAAVQRYEEPDDKELENARFKLLKLRVKIIWNISVNKENSLELESLKMVSAEDANSL